MTRVIAFLTAATLACAAFAPRASADVGPDVAQKLYERVTPSLVAVKYTWESELGRRELTGAGVVVSADGLVMTTIGVVDQRIPDAQLKDFKILIPSQEHDADEVPAEFQGRDERTQLAFVKAKPAGKSSDGDGKDKAKDKAKDKDDADKADKEGKTDKADKDEKGEKNEK